MGGGGECPPLDARRVYYPVEIIPRTRRAATIYSVVFTIYRPFYDVAAAVYQRRRLAASRIDGTTTRNLIRSRSINKFF